MFGAANENGLWRQRRNSELYKLFKEADIIKFIKDRTYEVWTHGCVLETTRGRPQLGWTDCVEVEFKVLRVINWENCRKAEIGTEEGSWMALSHHVMSSQ
ncbi:hypothetical protein CEXT_961 [Caerostris extrusa]|uniref:Uncharacterized protein n=1 Tax=Caerostris extrusa TaxID=172846 RepID=A0AAV4TMK3_CAEEX|nr:hypothetical protein CEXT_961 [Caerostris extrusa]